MIWTHANSDQQRKFHASVRFEIILHSTSYFLGFYFCQFCQNGTVFGLDKIYQMVGKIDEGHEVILREAAIK